MRCSGSPKCDCTLFRGDGRAKRCKSCRHDQGSHYETSSDDDSGDGDSGSSHDNSSNDTNLDTSDDNDDSESSSDTVRRPSASMKNKATVSSLVADLLNDGKSSRTEVEDAKREAKAGLMKKKYGSKQKANMEPGLKPKVMATLPPVTSPARVLKIVMFPYGKEKLAAQPPFKFPPLTDTVVLEEQGLVAHATNGISFCKTWGPKTMSSFLEQLLPRPFQYFKGQGFDEENPAKLPFCILKREDRAYVAVKPPANGPTGRIYQDNATGPAGGSYKNRRIVLISKRPIPQGILDEWKRRPVSAENGPGSGQLNAERDQPAQGSNKVRPTPKKVKREDVNDPPSDGGQKNHSMKSLKRARRVVESDGSDSPEPVGRSKGKARERKVKKKPIRQEAIVISDSEGGVSSETGNNGSETERELPSSRAAKRQRVRGPDHADEKKSIDLAASVSSLCLEEALPSAGPSTATSTVILGAWSTMRKASKAFVVGNNVAEAPFEF